MLELKIYENWKDLCKSMGWNGNAGGNTKKKYLKELDSLCKYHKEGIMENELINVKIIFIFIFAQRNISLGV